MDWVRAGRESLYNNGLLTVSAVQVKDQLMFRGSCVAGFSARCIGGSVVQAGTSGRVQGGLGLLAWLVGDPAAAWTLALPAVLAVRREAGLRLAAGLLAAQWLTQLGKAVAGGERPYWWYHQVPPGWWGQEEWELHQVQQCSTLCGLVMTFLTFSVSGDVRAEPRPAQRPLRDGGGGGGGGAGPVVPSRQPALSNQAGWASLLAPAGRRGRQ